MSWRPIHIKLYDDGRPIPVDYEVVSQPMPFMIPKYSFIRELSLILDESNDKHDVITVHIQYIKQRHE